VSAAKAEAASKLNDNMAAAGFHKATSEAVRTDSIAELFTALEGPLLGYAYKFSRDPEMAQDLVQEAFLRLHERFDTVRQPKSWLFRTVHNLALNQQRNSAKIVPLANTAGRADSRAFEPADAAPAPDDECDRWERIDQVRASLRRLDQRSQELIQLKFNDELSYKEISVRTGLTVGNVGYILHHALKALAAEFSRTGDAP
jgi:RNA polymerase sigma-70 factor (ECF subfamily)